MYHHPISHDHRPRWAQKLLSSPGAPKSMYTYLNMQAAVDWNMWRSTRIKLHLRIIELLSQWSFPLDDAPKLKAQSIDLLLTLTAEIACTIPYLLQLSPNGASDFYSPNDIPGYWTYLVMWSTSTSFLCLNHDTFKGWECVDRTTWFRSVLSFLRENGGIAKAQILLDL
jgi:hypothetical protein